MLRNMVVCGLLLAACSKNASSPSTMGASTPDASGSSGSPGSPGSPATAAAGSAVSDGCKGEIALLCPEGYEDGCIGARTTERVCVRKGATAGRRCDAKIALVCEAGERDACLHPAKSDRHICVRIP